MQRQNPEIQGQITNLHKSFWNAAYQGHIQSLKLLLENKFLLENKLLDVDFIFNGVTPLWVAVMSGNILIVKELLKANADVNIANYEGNTALHAACSKEHIQIVKLLIEAGGNINAENLIGRTPISYAYAENQLQVANYLLESGASPDLSQAGINEKFLKYLNFYPIIHPNKYDKDKIQRIKDQIKEGLCFGFSRINKLMKDIGLEKKLKQQLDLISTWDGSIATLQTNKDLESVLNSSLFNVFTLHISQRLLCEQDHIIDIQDTELDHLSNYYENVFKCGFVFKNDELESLLQIILREGIAVDLNIVISKNFFHTVSLTKRNQNLYEILDTNASIIKPIIAYSLSHAIKLLKLILRAESNCIGLGISIDMHQPNSEEKRKYLEIRKKFFDYLISLRLANNEIDLCDTNGLTSLFYALYETDREMAKKLISNQARPSTGKEFAPPIYLATQIGSYEIVDQLLSVGADVNSKCDKDTLLHSATSLGLIELVKLLLKKNATVDCVKDEGATPLYIACQNGFYEIAKELILAKANVNFSTSNRYTPLLAATSNGHSTLVELLINYGADINHKVFFTTPLNFAVERGFWDIVNILVDTGLILLDKDGDKSAIEFAKEQKQINSENYLISQNKKNISHSEQTFSFKMRKTSPAFFKANSKKGLDLIKTRHASSRAQKAYDENYGIISLNKSI